MIDPPRWSEEQLVSDSEQATAVFRKQRFEESLEDYLDFLERFQGSVEDLFESTVDLTRLEDSVAGILTDERLLHAFRYLAGPPISEDDLMTIAEVKSLVAGRLRKDADAVRRILEVIQTGIDRRRFPWVKEEREPTESEKLAAIIASAALMATRGAETHRRTVGKRSLEDMTENALTGIGFAKVARRKVRTHVDAPDAGHFCGETSYGERKADFVVRLWDNRVMPIECKSSNSEINSIKRVNNDAAAKAEAWRIDFGDSQVVPVAVIAGVFKPAHLVRAQSRGLTLFWGHNLKPMTDWIQTTRNG
jgi:hypothetical protein